MEMEREKIKKKEIKEIKKLKYLEYMIQTNDKQKHE